jgi:gamma-glutamylputrescine oxidase
MLKHEKLSYWERKSFLENIDFVIVGAGIVGYSTAIHLRKKYPNAKIVLLERGYLPSGASSKNAGFACFGSPTEIMDDLSRMPEESVWEAVEKRYQGLIYLQELLGNHPIGFEQNGSWDLIKSREDQSYSTTKEMLDYMNDNLYRITGSRNVYTEDSEVSNRFGFGRIATSFKNSLEAQIDTALLNTAFFQICTALGIHVLFDHTVLAYSSLSSGVDVETDKGLMHCANLIFCTNGFANALIPKLDLQPARAQVLVTEKIPHLKLNGTFHYDMGYYYFRNIDGRILLGGGRNLDFDGERTTEIETTEKIQNELELLLKEVILPNQSVEVTYRWAGIMGVGSEKRPIIKQLDANVYCGVRMGGMGVAIGSIVGKELATII